jgi:hypothetical protein
MMEDDRYCTLEQQEKKKACLEKKKKGSSWKQTIILKKHITTKITNKNCVHNTLI